MTTPDPLAAPAGPLRQLYRELILIAVRRRVERWWTYAAPWPAPEPATFPVLRQLLREVVLRRGGDCRAFLRLTKVLDSHGGVPRPRDRFVQNLAERFQEDSAAIAATVRPDGTGRPMVLAFPVWGRAYVDRFLAYCLPSLLAPGNLDILGRRRRPILLIHTDPEGRQRIQAAPGMARARTLGVEPRFLALDPAILARIAQDEDYKYWHLGLIQSLELRYAQALGADYHIMLPDTLYSRGFFERLLDAADHGREAVLQTASRSDVDRVAAELPRHRQDGTICLEPPDMMALALNAIHPAAEPLLMNRRTDPRIWPCKHFLMWEGEDTLFSLSPHHTVAYLDRAVVAGLEDRWFHTLDSELDKLLPETCAAGCARRADALALMELSPATLGWNQVPCAGLGRYAQLYWNNIESLRHLRLFRETVAYPVRGGARIGASPLDRTRIEEEMATLRREVERTFPVPSLPDLLSAFQALGEAREHPEARDLQPELEGAARDLWRLGRPALADGDPEFLAQLHRLAQPFLST
jgi:hypothetical protein